MRGYLVALAILSTAQLPQEPAPQTFRTGVDVVHVDVSVLDANRQPVRGLTAADFTILEDGKPRPIVAFSPVEIPVTPPLPAGTAAWVTEVSPDVATNDVPREGRLVVILFDHSIRNAQQAVARQIAKAAVGALGPADLAAIVHIGAGRAQNITRDRARLYEAIDAPMMGLVDGEEWITSGPTTRSDSPSAVQPSAERGQCPLGKCTLETITRIADSLRDLPRRKSLIFIATRMTIQDRDDSEVRRLREKMFRALDVANLTIYPVDPLGLETLAIDASRPSGTRPSAADQLAKRASNLERQGGLMVLSDRTGGRTVVNANDPDTIVPAMLAESSAYYSLGFESADLENKGRFHEISVRVNRRDVSVQSRRGHYAGVSEPDPNVTITGPPADLVAAVSSGWPKTDARIAIAASAFADPAGSRPIAAVTVSAPTAGAKLGVLVAAFDTNGRSVNHHWQLLDLSEVGDGRSTFDVLSRLPLDPGRYEIRAAVSGDDRRPGSVYTYLEVPDFVKAPLTMSGIVAEVVPPRLSAPGDAFEGLLPIVPTAQRDLARSDSMNAFVRLYQGGGDPLDAVQISATVQDARGRAAIEKRETLSADRFDVGRAADYRLELSTESLEPGPYLLSIEATRQKRSVRRDVRFTVK